MTKNLNDFTSFRRRERQIRKIEAEAAALKCEQIRLRQGCKHNIQILTRPIVVSKMFKREAIQNYQCLNCGYMYAEKNQEKIKKIMESPIIQEGDEMYLILDFNKYNIDKVIGEEKIAEIERICEEVIRKNQGKTAEQQLRAILNELKKFEK